MEGNYKLVIIKSEYCEYLRVFDNRVMYNTNKKASRPFVGILFEINNYNYFAPLSSPKPKHLKMKNNIDFYKIDGGKLGAINLNNMIPVPKGQFKYIDTNRRCVNPNEQMYQNLLKKQLRFLNREGKRLKNKALKLYEKRIKGQLPMQVINRCCDFRLLEEKVERMFK